MKQIRAFNKTIESLIEGGRNTAYSTVEQLQKEFPNYEDYYTMLDSLSFRLGFGMIAQECAEVKTDKTLGYIPKLEYYSDNKIEETPGIEDLAIEPMKLEDCYEALAKACLCKMTRLTDVVGKIKE